MKQVIIILSICLSFIVSACSDEQLPGSQEKERQGGRSVTFVLSKSDDPGFNVTTRNKGTVMTDEYAVVCYLFESQKNAVTGDYQYILVQKERVTTPLFTLENLHEESSYNYVFIATRVDNALALDAIDFSSVKMVPGDYTLDLPTGLASVESKSILGNCFLSFADYKTAPVYDYGETISMNNDLEIFGCGSYYLPGMTYSTPVNVVMERQIGVVEFRYTDAQAGDKLTCSFSSDYYRLYLSQMVKDTPESNYTSENRAILPAGAMSDMGTYETGDYYSASFLFKLYDAELPLFTKEVTLKEGENLIRIYAPYTTAEAPGTEVGGMYKANYIRTDLMGVTGESISGQHGDATLTVERGGALVRTYSLPATAFPIYRNSKTIFTTVGSDYLQLNIGDGGINIADDNWNGD